MKIKKTGSKLNQTQTHSSEPKSENKIKAQLKENKKINHNNFYRALEAFSDCV